MYVPAVYKEYLYRYQREMVVNTLQLRISMHIACLSTRYYLISQPRDCSFFHGTKRDPKLTNTQYLVTKHIQSKAQHVITSNQLFVTLF